MKIQDKIKYKNKNESTSNIDNKLNSILDRFLLKSEMDQSTTNNIEGVYDNLELTAKSNDFKQHKSIQSSVKPGNAQDKQTVIEIVDSDLEMTYSCKAKNDTSIIANDSLSKEWKKRKIKKKKHTYTVREKLKMKKDRLVKNDLNLTDKEDNELFFFDLSGNKINNTLNVTTYAGKSKINTSIISKRSKNKKKNQSLFNNSQLANKEDNELFFFDLSGCRTNSNLPQMTTQNIAKHTHFAAEDTEITYSGADSKQNETKLGKKKKLKQKELDKDNVSAKKKKNQIKYDHPVVDFKSQIQNSSLDLIDLINDDAPQKKKDKNAYLDKGGSSQEKKRKKKVKLEPQVENTEAELNFGNNLFSDYNSEIPIQKKRHEKGKYARIQAEHIGQATDFCRHIFTDSLLSEKKRKNTHLLSQSSDGTHLSNTVEKRKKKLNIKSEEVTSNQNNESKIEENQNEYGITYETFEDYLNMGQEDYTFHISSQILPKSDKSVQPIDRAEDDSFNKKKKKIKDAPENANNLITKTELVCKRDRTISEESFNTIIDSIVEDSKLNEETGHNSGSNEKTPPDKKKTENKHKNYTSSDFNFDTILDTLINNLDAKEQQKNDSNNGDSSISKKNKYSSTNLDSIEDHERLRVKKKGKTGDIKQEQIEELTEGGEEYDTMHVSQNEVLSLCQNSESRKLKKSKNKKDNSSFSIKQSSDALIIEEPSVKTKSKGCQERIEDLTEENRQNCSQTFNLSRHSDTSISKKSKKRKHSSIDPNSNDAIEETEDKKISKKNKQQIDELTKETEAYDRHLSLIEVLNLSRNTEDDDTLKKSKKKKKNSQETVINSQNKTHLSLNEVLDLSRNSDGNAPKKSKKKTTLIEEIESLLLNSQETADVAHLSQNSDPIISKKLKKETREGTVQDSREDADKVLSQNLFQEETLDDIRMFLENDFKTEFKEKIVVSEETKQDSGFEESDNNAKTKKKTVRPSNEGKKNRSDIELEKTLNTDSKRKKYAGSDEETEAITEKPKLGHANDSVNVVNIDKCSETDKWNVDDVFSDDEKPSNKIKRRLFQNRRNSGYDSDRDYVIKAKRFRRTRSVSESSDCDSKLIVTGCDVKELTEEELAVLRTLSVHLPFHNLIPPLHMIQRPSKPSVQDLANARKINAKFGSFTKDEDAQIIKNWKRFLKVHNLNVRPAVFFKFPNLWNLNDKIKFLQFLSHKLDDRMPYRVHARFQKIFESKGLKKGRYSFEEDKMIIEFINKTSSLKPFYNLGILLNRDSNSVERRYAFLTSGKNKTPVRWNTYMSERMIKAMMEIVGTENVNDLEHYVFKDAQWKRLSQILDNIPKKKLQRAWAVTIHSRLFMKGTHEEIKKQLVQMLIDNGEDDFRAISWKDYAEKFRGITPRKLVDTFRVIMRNVPRELRKDLKDSLQFLSVHSDFAYCSTQFRYRFKDETLVCKTRKRKTPKK